MKRFSQILLSVFIVSVITIQVASAAQFFCPTQRKVNCVPAMTRIGDWFANGGETTENTYMSNNQCANVIAMPNNSSRLVCCYTKCGVFLLDVPFQNCVKMDQSHFNCN